MSALLQSGNNPLSGVKSAINETVADVKEAVMGAGMNAKEKVTGRPTVSDNTGDSSSINMQQIQQAALKLHQLESGTAAAAGT